MTETTYSRIVVGRHSPKNKCFASDDEVLYVRPLANVPLKAHVAHHFVSVTDPRTTSQYGWVKGTDPFTLEEFISNHLGGRDANVDERAHLDAMFRGIAKLKAGTPVAATYSRRGIEEQRMELSVHRVFFYGAP